MPETTETQTLDQGQITLADYFYQHFGPCSTQNLVETARKLGARLAYKDDLTVHTARGMHGAACLERSIVMSRLGEPAVTFLGTAYISNNPAQADQPASWFWSPAL